MDLKASLQRGFGCLKETGSRLEPCPGKRVSRLVCCWLREASGTLWGGTIRDPALAAPAFPGPMDVSSRASPCNDQAALTTICSYSCGCFNQLCSSCWPHPDQGLGMDPGHVGCHQGTERPCPSAFHCCSQWEEAAGLQGQG